MALDEQGQLADDLLVASGAEVRVDAVLEEREPELVELGARPRHQWHVVEVGKRVPSPCREGLPERGSCGRGVTGPELRPRPLREDLDVAPVELIGIGHQLVAGPASQQAIPADGAS